MNLFASNPAPHGAGQVPQTVFQPDPPLFERLPMNLSPEEIRAMVLEVLG